MPVTTAKKGKKYRVVEAGTGNIALNAAGTPLDGGGHDSENRASRQARAVNASLRRQGKIKTQELQDEVVKRSIVLDPDDCPGCWSPMTGGELQDGVCMGCKDFQKQLAVWTTGEPWNPDGPGFEPSKQPRQIVYSCDAYGWPVAGGGPGVGIVGLPQRTADGEIHPGKNPIVPDFGTDYSRLDEEPWWREVYKATEAKPLGLILVRHGEADDGHEEMLDDERPLTKEGEKKLAKGFKGLARLGMTADRVVTSKTRRTEQTADLLSKAIGDGTYRTSDGLHHHDFDPKTACGLIQDQPKGSTLVLVGHHEWLGPFTDFLVNGTKMKGATGAPSKNHGIKFGYGSVARLEFENQRMPGNAHLHALFSPRSLRKLAK